MAKTKTELQIEFKATSAAFKKSLKDVGEELTTQRKELRLNSTELKGNSENAELLSQRQSILAKESETSQKKIDMLTKRIDEATEAFGEDSKEVSNLRDELLGAKIQFAGIQNDIKATNEKLDELDDSAESAGEQMQNLADNAKKSGDGFTVGKGVITNFISDGIRLLIDKCKEGIRWIAGLADETREFRQDMNTLTTAFDSANFSNEIAKNTWKELYAVFGEDDRAVEAANNISRMAKSEQDLNEWVKITTGIWGTYQDALPVESLAEAAGETAKTAKVTGTLADALNWNSEAAKMFSKYMSEEVTTAEDAFNVALSECSDEQERQQLITETLTALYGDAADEYSETAKNIMEANKATADLNTAQADLGKSTEELDTKIDNVKTKFIKGITPAVDEFAKAISDHIDLDLLEDKIQGLSESISLGVDNLFEAYHWCEENKGLLIGIVGVIGTVCLVYGIYNGLVALGTALKGAEVASLGGLIAVKWGLNAANWSLAASGMAALGPALLVIVIIAAVIAGIVLVVKNFDWLKAKGKGLVEFLGGKFKAFWENITEGFKAIPDTIKRFFEGLKNKIKIPKIGITYSTDGTLGKVAEAIGLPGFPKLNITWNKDGHFFTGKTLEIRGYAEAGDSEYALPLNSKTLDPLAAGIVNHMNVSADVLEVIYCIKEVYNEIRTGNSTIENKIIDAVSNRMKIYFDNREVGRVVRSF